MSSSSRSIFISQQINPYDVLVGRGNGVAKNPGNQHFRCLIWDTKDEYQTTSNVNKTSIAQRRVLDVLTMLGGRILEKVVKTTTTTTTTTIVNDKHKKNHNKNKKKDKKTNKKNARSYLDETNDEESEEDNSSDEDEYIPPSPRHPVARKQNTKNKNNTKKKTAAVATVGNDHGNNDDDDDDDNNENGTKKEYYCYREVPHKRALEKVCQALREKTKEPPQGYMKYCQDKKNQKKELAIARNHNNHNHVVAGTTTTTALHSLLLEQRGGEEQVPQQQQQEEEGTTQQEDVQEKDFVNNNNKRKRAPTSTSTSTSQKRKRQQQQQQACGKSKTDSTIVTKKPRTMMNKKKKKINNNNKNKNKKERGLKNEEKKKKKKDDDEVMTQEATKALSRLPFYSHSSHNEHHHHYHKEEDDDDEDEQQQQSEEDEGDAFGDEDEGQKHTRTQHPGLGLGRCGGMPPSCDRKTPHRVKRQLFWNNSVADKLKAAMRLLEQDNHDDHKEEEEERDEEEQSTGCIDYEEGDDGNNNNCDNIIVGGRTQRPALSEAFPEEEEKKQENMDDNEEEEQAVAVTKGSELAAAAAIAAASSNKKSCCKTTTTTTTSNPNGNTCTTPMVSLEVAERAAPRITTTATNTVLPSSSSSPFSSFLQVATSPAEQVKRTKRQAAVRNDQNKNLNKKPFVKDLQKQQQQQLLSTAAMSARTTNNSHQVRQGKALVQAMTALPLRAGLGVVTAATKSTRAATSTTTTSSPFVPQFVLVPTNNTSITTAKASSSHQRRPLQPRQGTPPTVPVVAKTQSAVGSAVATPLLPRLEPRGPQQVLSPSVPLFVRPFIAGTTAASYYARAATVSTSTTPPSKKGQASNKSKKKKNKTEMENAPCSSTAKAAVVTHTATSASPRPSLKKKPQPGEVSAKTPSRKRKSNNNNKTETMSNKRKKATTNNNKKKKSGLAREKSNDNKVAKEENKREEHLLAAAPAAGGGRPVAPLLLPRRVTNTQDEVEKLVMYLSDSNDQDEEEEEQKEQQPLEGPHKKKSKGMEKDTTTAFPSDLDEMLSALPPSLTAFASGMFHSSSSSSSASALLLSSNNNSNHVDLPPSLVAMHSNNQKQLPPANTKPFTTMTGGKPALAPLQPRPVASAESTPSPNNPAKTLGHASSGKLEQGDSDTTGLEEDDLTDMPPALVQLLRSISLMSQQQQEEEKELEGSREGPGGTESTKLPPNSTTVAFANTTETNMTNTKDDDIINEFLSTEDFPPHELKEITAEILKDVRFSTTKHSDKTKTKDMMEMNELSGSSNLDTDEYVQSDKDENVLSNGMTRSSLNDEKSHCSLGPSPRITRAVTHDVQDDPCSQQQQQHQKDESSSPPSSCGGDTHERHCGDGNGATNNIVSPSTVMDLKDVQNEEYDDCHTTNMMIGDDHVDNSKQKNKNTEDEDTNNIAEDRILKPPALHAACSSWSGMSVEPPSLQARHSLKFDEIEREIDGQPIPLVHQHEQGTTSATSCAKKGAAHSMLWNSIVADEDFGRCGRGNSSSVTQSTHVRGYLVAVGEDGTIETQQFLGPVQVMHVENGTGGGGHRVILKGSPLTPLLGDASSSSTTTTTPQSTLCAVRHDHNLGQQGAETRFSPADTTVPATSSYADRAKAPGRLFLLS